MCQLSSFVCLLLLLARYFLLPPFYFSFFTDTATTEIYPLSLHDALPISSHARARASRTWASSSPRMRRYRPGGRVFRSEEHTSELQSLRHLVCRLLLEKKKNKKKTKQNNEK